MGGVIPAGLGTAAFAALLHREINKLDTIMMEGVEMGNVGKPVEGDLRKFIETFSDFTMAVEARFQKEMDSGKHGWDNVMAFEGMLDRMVNKVSLMYESGEGMRPSEVEGHLIDIGVYVTFLWNLARERK